MNWLRRVVSQLRAGRRHFDRRRESSFEAERRGAGVTAIDCVEAPHFVELQSKLFSKVDYRILEIYELPAAGLGRFDIVFLLGVLYHITCATRCRRWRLSAA
jgi:hypothetical protein